MYIKWYIFFVRELIIFWCFCDDVKNCLEKNYVFKYFKINEWYFIDDFIFVKLEFKICIVWDWNRIVINFIDIIRVYLVFRDLKWVSFIIILKKIIYESFLGIM